MFTLLNARAFIKKQQQQQHHGLTALLMPPGIHVSNAACNFWDETLAEEFEAKKKKKRTRSRLCAEEEEDGEREIYVQMRGGEEEEGWQMSMKLCPPWRRRERGEYVVLIGARIRIQMSIFSLCRKQNPLGPEQYHTCINGLLKHCVWPSSAKQTTIIHS